VLGQDRLSLEVENPFVRVFTTAEVACFMKNNLFNQKAQEA